MCVLRCPSDAQPRPAETVCWSYFLLLVPPLCSVSSQILILPLSSLSSALPPVSFPLTYFISVLCMLQTCSCCSTCSELCCSTCSELFVQVSEVKATLVGPLSWSLWLWGSPLKEPGGEGATYTRCQWDRHNGLALSIAWAWAWGRHQHLVHSTPASLPPPSILHPNRPAAM